MRSIFVLSIVLVFSGSAFSQTEAEIVARFKQDISYLASDELEGRLTGSDGEQKSSTYIANQFLANGILPYGDNGQYFQNFSIIRVRIAMRKEYLKIKDNIGKLEVIGAREGEFYPIAYSCNKDSINLPVFQAGYGINTKDYNDYKDTTDIRGKIFVIKLGSPEVGTAHNKYEPYESIGYKVDEAIKHGARGIVFVRNDTFSEIPKSFLDRSINPRKIPIIFSKTKTESILNASIIDMQVNIAQLNSTAHNVVGFMNNKKKKTIIIGAHQDHLGYNEYGGSRTKAEGKIHNGADDNASGIAMMLELMRKIKKSKKLKKCNYVFIAFSGEEQGLLGSNYFVKHTSLNLKKVKYMLNFDMVGRLDSIKKALMIYGVGTSPEWKTSIAKLETDSTQIKIKTAESGTGSSDHTNFYYQNIPVLHYFSGQHSDYHMPSDDEHLINYHGMYLSYDVVIQMLKNTRKIKNFTFTPTKSEESQRMSFKVTLGIMPDYAFDGVGMRVDGVTLEKAGAKAGLLKNDIITKLGEYSINSVETYMKALSTFKKGDTTTMVIKRGAEEKTLTVTF